jgi:hypothetical protein
VEQRTVLEEAAAVAPVGLDVDELTDVVTVLVVREAVPNELVGVVVAPVVVCVVLVACVVLDAWPVAFAVSDGLVVAVVLEQHS